jgi:hypothetical protein
VQFLSDKQSMAEQQSMQNGGDGSMVGGGASGATLKAAQRQFSQELVAQLEVSEAREGWWCSWR